MVLAGVLSLALAGCGNQTQETGESAQVQSATESTTNAEEVKDAGADAVVQMELLKEAILQKKDIRSIAEIEKHADWVDKFLPNYEEVNIDNIDEILQKEIGLVFCQVLSDAGVFKRDEAGKAAFRRFVTSLS